jgi:K+-sensing histidine kinase KdpD
MVLLRGRPLFLFDDRRALVRIPLRLLASVVGSVAALWAVSALQSALAFPFLFPSFVAIVLVSAGFAGTSYGILTVVLFGAGYEFLYMEPRNAFGVDDPHMIAVLVAYGVAGVVVALVGGALRRAYARLREEHRAVTTIHAQREDILRALSHDVRSPLGVITTSAAMLARDPEDPAVVRRRARAIEKSGARVADMLGELVDTAHLESGHLPLERTAVDLASFVAELRGHLGDALPLDRVTFAVPGGLSAAYVDPRSFERILVNLLSNALKYAPSPTPVVLGAAAQDGNIVVSVADRGPGISQQDLPHIFEKYYRASGTQKKEGLGIGLYSARLLVQAHGGRIWAESAPGKGTTFYVALPTAPPEGRPVAASASTGRRPPAAVPPYRQAPTATGNDSGSLAPTRDE